MNALMTNDTARVEAALEWQKRYNAELDAQAISPNGDDFNALVDGLYSILHNGIVLPIRITPANR